MLCPETGDVLAFQVRSTECCTGTVPDPENETTAGEFVALLTNDTVPEAGPLVWGTNEIVTLFVAPAASVSGRARPLVLNPMPVKFAAETETDAVPVFESVTVLVAVLPCTTLPKLKLVGETLST